ncbi:hypothetical protein BJ138DRAFT_178119 [Hygrophoropsis aurantiaca]|uniref:Uncharacterized protein n=1 Tax=Hygrophoropsis aurantiaca TaxID=72124 RepID=A0ACB8APL7_9AGAM|nr:hypothetical protein BJ138DRAFT_178119 [Hygrophoropsis aurantiaca]
MDARDNHPYPSQSSPSQPSRCITTKNSHHSLLFPLHNPCLIASFISTYPLTLKRPNLFSLSSVAAIQGPFFLLHCTIIQPLSHPSNEALSAYLYLFVTYPTSFASLREYINCIISLCSALCMDFNIFATHLDLQSSSMIVIRSLQQSPRRSLHTSFSAINQCLNPVHHIGRTMGPRGHLYSYASDPDRGKFRNSHGFEGFAQPAIVCEMNPVDVGI